MARHRVLVSVATLCCYSIMNNRIREWSDVRVFLAVMRAGSTLAASRTLEMSQPTVARRIDVLEHVLGLALFERTTKGFHPTGAAKALLPQAEALEAAAIGFAATAKRQRQAPSKPIRFSMPPVALTKNLTAIVAKFRSDNPETSFDFLPTRDPVDLMAGDADIALRYAREIPDDRVIRFKLSDIYSSLFASEAYADAHGLPATEADLADHRFVLRDGTVEARPGERWLASRITADQVAMRCQDFEALFAGVQTGAGIGILPVVRAHFEGGLVECFAPPDPVSSQCWLLLSPSAYQRPDVKAFAKVFAEEYRAFLADEWAEIRRAKGMPHG